MREAAYALGSSDSRVVLGIVVPFALPGILTGVLLALAIAIGETTPLLYTAGWSNYLWTGPLHEGASRLPDLRDLGVHYGALCLRSCACVCRSVFRHLLRANNQRYLARSPRRERRLARPPPSPTIAASIRTGPEPWRWRTERGAFGSFPSPSPQLSRRVTSP